MPGRKSSTHKLAADAREDFTRAVEGPCPAGAQSGLSLHQLQHPCQEGKGSAGRACRAGVLPPGEHERPKLTTHSLACNPAAAQAAGATAGRVCAPARVSVIACHLGMPAACLKPSLEMTSLYAVLRACRTVILALCNLGGDFCVAACARLGHGRCRQLSSDSASSSSCACTHALGAPL